ncbi:cytochrome P450 [Actinoplanes friuliensis]|uniref:Cytochrome P450 n=1 Tax=Actinoplanes friuliensis DSM 7358 TaxID=1246995 RepID=U5W523_9ACTN|nr:cytochrome P450 [Actinoplanes friuliensis]AGZ44318.1 cytochrome P450 [Actinoplanes friuliensis DSM 7358]
MSEVLPLTRTCPFAPPAEHLRLQETEPVARVTLPTGEQVWALSRIDDVRTMLTDPRFSADRTHPGFPHLDPGRRAMAGALKGMMVSMDPPEHGVARGAVMGEFTARKMAALRPQIQQIVDECLDTLLAGPQPADLVRALSLPVPSLVICRLLGVPYADHEFFQRSTEALLLRSTPPQQRQTALGGLYTYLQELIARKATEPGDDLLSRQLGEAAEPQDVVSLAMLLLIAGHETTANMISLGVMMLLEHPDQLAVIREDPTKTPLAVEELLRYFTIGEFSLSRVAVGDVELGGKHIRAGEGVVVLSNAANRDPAAFTDGDRFDVERGARHHIAFGFGAHQCLGQNLARLELQIVLDTLVRRIPGLRLAVPVDDLPFKDDANIYGLYELPVTWTAP